MNELKLTTICAKCKKWLHIVNQRYCCGIDYYYISIYRDEIDEWMIKTGKREHDYIERISKLLEKREKKSLKEAKKTKKKKRSRKNIKVEERIKILKRDKHRCSNCGCRQKAKHLHVHHKIPKSKGGSDEESNLITLCDVCHMEEHRGEPVYNIMIKSLLVYETIVEVG